MQVCVCGGVSQSLKASATADDDNTRSLTWIMTPSTISPYAYLLQQAHTRGEDEAWQVLHEEGQLRGRRRDPDVNADVDFAVRGSERRDPRLWGDRASCRRLRLRRLLSSHQRKNPCQGRRGEESRPGDPIHGRWQRLQRLRHLGEGGTQEQAPEHRLLLIAESTCLVPKAVLVVGGALLLGIVII